MNRIANLRTYASANSVRVDRSTILGNPFRIGRDGTREEVIGKYLIYALARLARGDVAFRAALLATRGKDLLCWCHPLPCHAEVVRDLAEGAAKWM